MNVLYCTVVVYHVMFLEMDQEKIESPSLFGGTIDQKTEEKKSKTASNKGRHHSSKCV